MFGGTGGFAQTPDVLSRLHPGRKPVSLQRSPTRKEAVFARPTGPSARKSGSGVFLRQEQKPYPPRRSSGQRSACRRRRSGLRAPAGRAPPSPGRGARGRDPTTAPPRGRWGRPAAQRGKERGARAGWGWSGVVPKSWRPAGPRGACLHPQSHPGHLGYRAPSPAHSAGSFPDPEAPDQLRASRPIRLGRGDPGAWSGRARVSGERPAPEPWPSPNPQSRGESGLRNGGPERVSKRYRQHPPRSSAQDGESVSVGQY